MSKIKVNEIEAQSGSTITIPTGQTLTVTDGIPATNLSGTIADARLPTVPVTKGGTGLTSLGTAGQALKVNSGGTALEFGSAGSTTLLGNGESSNVTSLAINNSVLTSAYEIFEIYMFMSKASGGGGGQKEMFVSTSNGSSTDPVDRLYHFAQVNPSASVGHSVSSAGINQDRMHLNVGSVTGDFHNSKITIMRPQFTSSGERNRNTILSEAVSSQNPGTSINVENLTAFACIHDGNANRQNDIDYVRFEMNGAGFDIKWAVYGRKW